MDEIEKNPQSNRQLKNLSTNRRIEEVLNKINLIYQARQKERIIYQRRETQIRQEIENISHDLRTPLTSIMGYVELLQDKETKEEEKEEYLQIISKRARVLQAFIQDFYEISRMEAEDYPLLLDKVSVQHMVGEAAVSYYHEFETKNIHVTIDLEERPCYIIADKIQYNRILNNLIQNALKYAKKQFMIKQYSEKGRCILQFRNDKSNMKEEKLKLVFDRFYTGDQTRSNGSTGLGLTITRILVEKMKGAINARFEEDMFVIELQWPEKAC
jgi:signal transduction histidine kinase